MLQTVQQFLAALDPGYVWAAAMLGALAYSVRSARREGLDLRIVYWAGVLAIVFGLWGGHLLGIVYYGTDGRPFAWLRFWSGGQAQFGGLIAGAIAVFLFLKARKISLLTYADAIVPAVALGVSLGRIGCFLNGDDFGTLSLLPWAVQFPPGTEAYADHFSRGWIASTDALSLPVHPVQLYATLVWLGLFVILVVYRPEQAGRRLTLFAVLQGAGRFVEQFSRGDFQAVLGPFSLTQLIGLFFVAAGVVIFLHSKRRKSADVAASNELVISHVGPRSAGLTP
jgi:phosphatidylglycerol:prolipoprotein diacylglycerol transferase